MLNKLPVSYEVMIFTDKRPNLTSTYSEGSLTALVTLQIIVNQVEVWFSGNATRVNFHVTVMSLDSINEGSMVSNNIMLLGSHKQGQNANCH